MLDDAEFLEALLDGIDVGHVALDPDAGHPQQLPQCPFKLSVTAAASWLIAFLPLDRRLALPGRQ